MTRSTKEMVLTKDALGESEWGIGASTVRRTWMMFLAALLAVAAAMVVSATQTQGTNATSTVSATTCNGGTIQLNADEERTLDLHNQTKPAPQRAPRFVRAPRAHQRCPLSLPGDARQGLLCAQLRQW